MQTLIFDTAALFNFGHRGQLEHLLPKLSLHFTLLTTSGVLDEITDPKQKPFYQALVAAHFKLQNAATVPFDIPTLARLTQALDPGELTVLLLARELNAIAVLDERPARSHATRLGIALTGTIGLLQHCVTQNWLTEADCLATIHQLCDRRFKIRRPAAREPLADYLRAMAEPSNHAQ